jgi:hypothetical protein
MLKVRIENSAAKKFTKCYNEMHEAAEIHQTDNILSFLFLVSQIIPFQYFSFFFFYMTFKYNQVTMP